MAAPYPPPRVNKAILSGQTIILEGAERARILVADCPDRSPLWVICRHSASLTGCPLYPESGHRASLTSLSDSKSRHSITFQRKAIQPSWSHRLRRIHEAKDRLVALPSMQSKSNQTIC